MSTEKTFDFEAITGDQIRDYCEASGDWNKIHWDQQFAVEAGLPGIIAHGMLTMGLVGRALEAWGYPYESIGHMEAKFKEKVAVGEILQARLVPSNTPKTLEVHIVKPGEIQVLQASINLK